LVYFTTLSVAHISYIALNDRRINEKLMGKDVEGGVVAYLRDYIDMSEDSDEIHN
jgi:hypothetical protein